MPIILKDDNGLPIPQYKNATSGNFEAANGSSGAVDSNIKTWPDGTDATGVIQLTGGVGIRGWLSGIFSKLSGILTAKIDSLPAAMVAADGSLEATILQKNVKSTLTTIVNAQSVGAGLNTGAVNLGCDGTESEVYLIITVDQQPWGAGLTNPSFGSGYGDSIYPSFWNKATAYPNTVAPAIGLCLGTPWAATGGANPTSLSIAKDMILPIQSSATAIFYNQSAVTATFTVKVLRIWK